MEHLLNISCSELNSSGQGQHTIRAYQLNPGVDADSNGIHWLHIVPPVSGDIQHLSRGDTKPSEPLMDQQFSGITIVFLSGSLCDKCWGSTKLSWSSTRWQQTPFLFCQQVIRSWSDPIFKWASLIDHSLLSPKNQVSEVNNRTFSQVFSFASCSVKKSFYICTYWPTYTLILIYVMSHDWYISRVLHLTIIFHYLLIQLLFSWVYIMSKLQLQHRNCPSLCTSQVAVSELWRWIMARTLLLQNIMTSQWIWPQIKCHNFHILSYDTFVS